MTTFSKWIHPATGQVRVYIAGFGQTKVWAEACPVDAFGSDYKIVVVNQNKNRSELGNSSNEAERTINIAAQSRVKTFAAVLALAA